MRVLNPLGFLGVMVAMGLSPMAATVDAQEDELVNDPSAVHDQTAKHFQEVTKVLGSMGTPQTPFDYIHPALSGPVVVLQGFVVNSALKGASQDHVQKLKWVTHVVNQIEILPLGPNYKRMRRQTLAKLKHLVPQAFPQNHAYIRIKIAEGGDVTLIGVVSPDDGERLAAAVEQIKHIELVRSVTNNIVELTD